MIVAGKRVRETQLLVWALRGVLILHLGLSLGYVGLWVLLARQGLFWRADFTAFYTGWSIVRDGQGARLYDLDLQTHYQAQILEGQSFREGLLPYVNPPYATLPFVPLAWLPRSTAFWIWTLGQVALLVWLLRLLRRIAHSWQPHERRLLLSAVVAFPPLLTTFALGTFSLFMLVCLLQFYLALKQNRAAQTGLWLALGTVKPQIMLLPGVLAVGARRWRALGYALLIGGVLAALSGALLGWQIWPAFVQVLRTVNDYFGVYGIVPSTMYNFKGTLTLLLGNGQGALINQISSLALVGAAALTWLLWRGQQRPDDPSFELRVALTMLLGLLFSPHMHPQDGLLLVAPATLFYAYLRQRGPHHRLYAALVLSCPLLFLVAEFTIGGSLGIRVPVVVMGALALWMLRALVAERSVRRSCDRPAA